MKYQRVRQPQTLQGKLDHLTKLYDQYLAKVNAEKDPVRARNYTRVCEQLCNRCVKLIGKLNNNFKP